jgi:DNA-directed RNA polymerase specialized sigma subunit
VNDKNQRDSNYTRFIGEMNAVLQENDVVNGMSQRDMMNQLFTLEREFKVLLLENDQGPLIYEQFMNFILADKADGGKENKLSIRPYFRERQDTFSNKMFPILDEAVEREERRPGSSKLSISKKLHKFRINYLFMKWTLDIYRGPNKRKLNSLLTKVIDIRKLLCENNLPLACNRVALFKTKTPLMHLEYMDLMQDASKGLIEAIDKFVPPYKTVFRTTAIGRMTLNMSEDFSSTLVKLPPKDKRILYRARKAKQSNADISGKELTAYVNESFAGVTAADIEMIEAAANQVESLSPRPAGQRTAGVVKTSRAVDDRNQYQRSAETELAEAETSNKLLVQLGKLKIIEKKVLVMKSGEIYGVFKED